MDELEVTIGQRSLASVHGEQTTAAAYAGLGARHLLVIADGADGPVPTRLAAQVAASAAVARFRASVFPRTEEQLEEAFTEAHHAVRRGAIGSHAEGQSGASMVAVVIEGRAISAARIGGGRVYILDEDHVHALFRDGGEGFVGDVRFPTELAIHDNPLRKGARVIMMSESVARGVIADFEQLAGEPPPQLSAARLVEAARRRGQYAALTAQVVEVQQAVGRGGPHPAVSRLGRATRRTLSADGRWLGKETESGSTARSQARAEAGWALWFALAVLLGAGAALIAHGGGDDPAQGADAQVARAVTTPMPEIHLDPPTRPAPPPPDVVDAPPSSGLTLDVEEEIGALFDKGSPPRSARALKNYITKRYPIDGDGVFADLEAWIMAHDDPSVVATLLELVQEEKLKKTQRWITELLPRLYQADAGADAAP
ncbi:MAG: protein phosphatase 2C domain-containing protein [Deltaproteobacteria bacterium]|nr:protein phosphatase 2C domain-containing protein [Deltaproteobacteria bacterium]